MLQHTLEDSPGYLGQWLDAQGVSWQVLCAEAGEAYPDSVRGFRALAVLGGEWGANDDRPTLRQAETLILEADALGIPVIGHCLGGQLIARAFGGRVERLSQPEVGWLFIQMEESDAARAWLGEGREAVVYQWHYDSFVELPKKAEVLAASAACAHQAFAIGIHLAMQFHIEITPEKIATWLAAPGEVYPAAISRHPDSVQSPVDMNAATRQYQKGSQALADHIYTQWRSRWR